MGNQPGKYFEESFQVEHSKFELRALMQTVDGAFEKCIDLDTCDAEGKLAEAERRCVLEYCRTREAFHKSFRNQFEAKIRKSFEEKQAKMEADAKAAQMMGGKQ